MKRRRMHLGDAYPAHDARFREAVKDHLSISRDFAKAKREGDCDHMLGLLTDLEHYGGQAFAEKRNLAGHDQTADRALGLTLSRNTAARKTVKALCFRR
jgi:hypothetical protein